jgi:hypothetical protein
MTITKDNVLTLALILSIGLNIYEMLKEYPHCDDTNRYSMKASTFGGLEISKDWATRKINAYREDHVADRTIYQTTGFMVSKKALDKIFDSPGFNTLCIDLVQNDDNILSLIVKGTITDSTEIKSDVSSGIFINQSMCPTDCSQ